VTVAVLDTGVLAHPTFGENQVSHIDLVKDGKAWHSHGTSVASLIAGQDERVPGVAPGAKILDIRVANEKGDSVSSVLALGVMEAINGGAHVINISMGGAEPSPLLQQAINQAIQRGVVVVAAAGNERMDTLAYPAGYPGVISMSSVDAQGKQATFSNGGNQKGYAAPSVGLYTAWDTDKMATVSGTSQASAVGAGIVATGLSRGETASTINNSLTLGAKQVTATASAVGHGVIQVSPNWQR
jgi:hypothetical protein